MTEAHWTAKLTTRRLARAAGAAVTPLLAGMWLTTLTGCNLQEPAPFEPRTLGAVEREAAGEVPRGTPRTLPQGLDSPFFDERAADLPPQETITPEVPPTPLVDQPQTVALPLREVIARTVLNNGEVRVAGYTPAIEQTRITEAEARFDPRFFVQGQYQRTDRLTTPQFTGRTDPITGAPTFVTTDESETITGGLGIRQLLPTGGQAELRYNVGRNRLDPNRLFDPGSVTNPFYEADLVLQITQPLLRDFGSDVNRARIVINRNNQQIALLDFRNRLEEVLSQTEQTYWQLVQAQAEVEIQEDLLQRTVDTADLLSKRRVQDVNRQQLGQAVSEVESRTADLILLRSRVRDLSDQLKRLMNDAEFPVAGATLVLPDTPPVLEPVTFDFQDAVTTALENRPEIAQQLLRVRSAGTALRVGENNLLPSLNLILSGGFQGIGSDLGEAVDAQTDFNNLSAGVGLELEVPIGNREARSIYRRAQLQRQQSIEQYRSLVAQVSLDVKQSLRQVETAYQLIGQRRRARFASAEALEAIQARQDAGEALTPQFVDLKLALQANLANAQRQEAASVADYNIAVATLERAKGTLLRYNNVLLEESTLPGADLPTVR